MNDKEFLKLVTVQQTYKNDPNGIHLENEDNKRALRFLTRKVIASMEGDDYLQEKIKNLLERKKFSIPLVHRKVNLLKSDTLGTIFSQYEFGLKLILGKKELLVPVNKGNALSVLETDIALMVAVDFSSADHRDTTKGVNGVQHDFPFRFNHLPPSELDWLYLFFFGNDAKVNLDFRVSNAFN